MIRRLQLYQFFFRSCCFVLPLASFAAAAFVLRGEIMTQGMERDYFFLAVLLTLVWIVACEHFEVTYLPVLLQDTAGVRNCTKALLWTYMSGFTALFFYRGASYSRLLFATSAILMLSGNLLLRALFRQRLLHMSRGRERTRVAIVGTDAFALRTAQRLASSKIAPCEPVAFVRVPGQPRVEVPGVPVYELEELLNRNLHNFADDVVIAVSPETLPVLSTLVRELKSLAVPIRLILDFGGDFEVRDRLFRVGGTSLLDVRIAPTETIGYVILKRGFDVVFALFALAIAALPMLLIAAAVKLTSPGPVLFAQERVGLNGQVFRMLKFRTMKVAPPSVSDTQWTTPNAARLTPIGAFLRKSSLDELPQFLNVLRGEMSVVGPRPERPHFVEKFNGEIEAYNTRHHLKAGITGWAQVCGLRGDTDIAKRVEADLYYMRNWSFIFDLRIILLTLVAGMFAKNAY
ncbi:MAG: exopolysaccharide biosynthesis polyprenyl glycosylphosphotransferase [Acidobacteriota bacterium]|nr:exopolysaccharide biosynthesis polyprenyl glycosylphosphotransferase [Acidobacteriota bacterium]